MDVLTEKLAELGKKHGKAFLGETLEEVAFPALKLAVEKSESKIDDVVLAALEVPLKEALKELISKI